MLETAVCIWATVVALWNVDVHCKEHEMDKIIQSSSAEGGSRHNKGLVSYGLLYVQLTLVSYSLVFCPL